MCEELVCQNRCVGFDFYEVDSDGRDFCVKDSSDGVGETERCV